MIEVCKRKEILTGEILTGYGWSIKKWLYGLGLEAFFLLLLNEREKSPAGKIIDPSCQRLGQPIRAHDLLRLINSWFWHDFLIWRLIYMSGNFCTGKFAVSWDDVIYVYLVFFVKVTLAFKLNFTYQLTDLQEVEENISFPLLRDGPLENLWGGGRSTLFGQGKIKWKKKIHARQLILKIFMSWPKKIHTKNLITKKKSCDSKIPTLVGGVDVKEIRSS